MSSDFFTAEEDPESYNSVCDISRNKSRENKNVLTAFSSLQCPGDKLHEWEFNKPLYIRKFKKAKQCVQRRITKMKDFSGRSAANKTSRKKHVYPIQVAYAYGKDCLKKFGSKKQQATFEKSVNDLIKSVSKEQPNVQGYFGNSIENTILTHSPKNVKNILDKTYYDDLQLNTINKERNLGYNALNETNKQKFFSLFNNGRSENALENENSKENENSGENEYIRPPSKTLKKNFRSRRATKRTPSIKPPPNINISKLDLALQENEFKITDKHKREEIKERIKKIVKLFREQIMIDEKIYFIGEIYNETFSRYNKVNTNVIAIATKLAGQSITKKLAKQVGLTEKNLHKYNAYEQRTQLSNDLARLHRNLIQRSDKIDENIYNTLTKGDPSTILPLEKFYNTRLYTYMSKKFNKEISLLSPKENERLIRERNKIYGFSNTILAINNDILATESLLSTNLAKQKKVKDLLKNPDLAVRSKEELKKLKEAEVEINNELVRKYKEKTNKIRNIEEELSKTIDNVYILKDKLSIMPPISSFKKINNV
jgi:hypothetical protein